MDETGTSNQSMQDNAARTPGLDENDRHSLQTYVSGMLALERHIEQPVDQQRAMSSASRYPEAARVVGVVQSQVQSHIAALQDCLKQLGGHEADPVKSAWAGLLGIGAKAVNVARKTKISKSLRDDYAALTLASISYEMLYTTAVGLGRLDVADLAKRHLADYARSVMEIGQCMPSVVLQELRDDGENVTTSPAETIRHDLNEVWKAQAVVTR